MLLEASVGTTCAHRYRVVSAALCPVVAVDASETGRQQIRTPGSPQIGSTASFPEKYGEKLIPAMIKLIDGEKLPPAIYVDHVFITKENVNKYYPDDPM